ncbi:MAG: 3-dehydroquinate synthase [Pyrinomonadaceae bacterium]
MKSFTIPLDLTGNSINYNITIGSGIISSCEDQVTSCLEGCRKVTIVSNSKIFGLYGSRVRMCLEGAGFDVRVWLMTDGERHKNFRSLTSLLESLSENHLSRTDAVVALGGGVVGDLAGFASAVYLRGIRFLQIPTTLLAMIDSSVGGKTGINSPFGKNLIGAFHQPSGVIIDTKVLDTLPRRELTAGLCEAVKQAAIDGPEHYNTIEGFLKQRTPLSKRLLSSDASIHQELAKLIKAQVSFKARIVSQDQRENADRVDKRSRKILNFGHTLAHALEKVTEYKYFKHGEAVGHGIVFASRISRDLGLLDGSVAEAIEDLVRRTGRLPNLSGLEPNAILDAFKFDKKQVNESLQFVLLRDIGEPVIMAEREISKVTLEKTLRTLTKDRS